MSKMSKAVSDMNEKNSLRLDETVTNFMGGDSYIINPLDTLKMISASSIFGEPSYYRGSKYSPSYIVNKFIKEFSVIPKEFEGKTTNEIFESAIDAALDYDFGGTLDWAIECRDTYNMRLNPQVIMVRAAVHPKRSEWTNANPGRFNTINALVMRRADEPMTQMAYYMYQNDGKKNDIPSILKRSWAKKMSHLNRYNVAKYKNHEIGMINAVRLCHANSPIINELMTKGTVDAKEDLTWENLRSEGKSWREIFESGVMGHMALLRNLRNIFSEVEDIDFCNKVLDNLKSGVVNGKQFPFRYWSAMNAVKTSNKCNHKAQILDALEECIDISLENTPKLKGKTMCLSDNSGSAWGTFNSEYGSVTVAEIDNLSSVITAACSDEGYVGKFGDRLKVTPISKRQGVLHQAEDITTNHSSDVGGATEGGIWEFFKNAINKKEHWDNIFIYSDMQAGHGGLYGTSAQFKEYGKTYGISGSYINVFKLIQDYRKKVNPKVNVFCIQTAGYDNVLIPEYAYRTNIMYGWTGREAQFADAIIKQWNDMDSKNVR
jgi:hypothetical protein